MTTIAEKKGHISTAGAEYTREEKRCMASPSPQPPVDVVEQFKALGAIVGSIAASIGLYATIKTIIKKWREKHPTFRRTVLSSLQVLQDGQKHFADFNAAMLRERLESLYNVYVLEMGWCPRSAKQNIRHLFELFFERFGEDSDHLIRRNCDMIMALPESKDQRRDYNQ